MSLDIKFENLVYCARSFSLFQKDEKNILKGISGEFRANELSAIMGPSGSGKSTLLNVLSEYMTNGVTGSITINGEKWNNKRYKKKFAYIMQEENLHAVLTVKEAMRFSIKLKTGNSMTEKEQQKKILSILETLKLDNKLNTYAQYLSGGQQKRLSIALELVDDPQVLFLDECTTGLDSVSSTQCIQFLKKLAMEGRTIICTIHTPSALMFEMFDHIYALANGNCIFQGASFNVVLFLKELGLVCPSTYNPADFLLEIANNDYGSQNERLTKVIENGKNEFYRGQPCITLNNNNELKLSSTHDETLNEQPSSFVYQLALLVLRNYKISHRNVTLIIIRLVISSIVGLMVGGMYLNIGNDGTAFPLELPIIKREVFNRWYTSSVYYVALSLTDIPMTIISTSIYLTITYFMTNQPLDRAVAFFAVGLLTSFVSQGFGHFASSLFDLQVRCLMLNMLLNLHFLCLSGNSYVCCCFPTTLWHFLGNFYSR
ncbi:hypothetical protein ACKWTF_011772 [Chironomus riparius]